MESPHPKHVRRLLLERLYERYMNDPLDMVGPVDLMEDGLVTRENLVPNIHYLHDRGLVELMLGFSPPLFDGARITAEGIDLVENLSEFGLRFPDAISEEEARAAEIPLLIERLVEEADLCALDGEARRALLRDIYYLREELARPFDRWRAEVILTVLGWIEKHFIAGIEPLPSFEQLRSLLEKHKGLSA
jgi:hypothetical protein